MKNKEQLFGVQATEYIRSDFNLLAIIKRFLRLQNIKFWLLTYLLSLIIFQFFKSHILFIDPINFILFPFSVIIIGTFANQFILSMPRIYRLLYPTYKENLSNSKNKFMLIITNAIKLFIYIVVWKYTFILGIIGLIITINNTRILIK